MDNGCLVIRKWQVEPAKIERRRWNRRRTTALQTLTNERNEPSLEHGYRVLNSIVGVMGLWGGMAAFMADMYESAFVWFKNQTAELERRMRSNEFWFNLYGY